MSSGHLLSHSGAGLAAPKLGLPDFGESSRRTPIDRSSLASQGAERPRRLVPKAEGFRPLPESVGTPHPLRLSSLRSLRRKALSLGRGGSPRQTRLPSPAFLGKDHQPDARGLRRTLASAPAAACRQQTAEERDDRARGGARRRLSRSTWALPARVLADDDCARSDAEALADEVTLTDADAAAVGAVGGAGELRLDVLDELADEDVGGLGDDAGPPELGDRADELHVGLDVDPGAAAHRCQPVVEHQLRAAAAAPVGALALDMAGIVGGVDGDLRVAFEGGGERTEA